MKLGNPITPHPVKVIADGRRVVDVFEQVSITYLSSGLDMRPLPLQVGHAIHEVSHALHNAYCGGHVLT